jgi:polysaccharide biosynthesis/export protein
MTLLQTIALAEGVDETASLANLQQIHLYRAVESGKRDLYIYNLDEVRNGTVEDPLIRGDDIVVVPKNRFTAAFKRVGDLLRNVVYFSIGASLPLFQ